MLREAQRVQLPQPGQLRRVQLVEHRAGARDELGVRRGFGVARNRRRGQVRVRAHGSVDGVERLGSGQDQGQLEPAQERPQRLVDLPRVLAHPHLLPLRALQAPTRRTVRDRGLPGGAGDVCGKTVDRDLERIDVRGHLEQAHRPLREREHERRVRERDRSQEGLHVESIGHLDDVDEAVGKPKRSDRRGRREHGEAPRLVAPELAVVDNVADRFLDRGDVPARRARLSELSRGLVGQVPQLDPFGLAA